MNYEVVAYERPVDSAYFAISSARFDRRYRSSHLSEREYQSVAAFGLTG
jgi:hypothetical protein